MQHMDVSSVLDELGYLHHNEVLACHISPSAVILNNMCWGHLVRGNRESYVRDTVCLRHMRQRQCVRDIEDVLSLTHMEIMCGRDTICVGVGVCVCVCVCDNV